MKKILLSTFLIVYCTTFGAQEAPPERKRCCKQPASCASREASVLSMMGWGVGIFAGIAVLCALINSNPDHTNGTPTNP